MKKYLMIGFVAAVAFSSCSKNDFETYSPEEIVKAEYDAKFIAEFGQPASNQTWGFGSGTRAFTRGADPRGNMWADLGWNVPPALTNDQKELVRQYFQQNQAKKYEDPQLTNYWVQQVYKGGTKCKNNGDDNSKTTEKYQSANNDWVVGSDHMDHLEAVLPNGTHEHINDFNYGNCTDFEGTMLMVQSGTKEFGYFNSDGSLGHTDYTSLVSWRTIAEWAVGKGLATSVEACVLNDKWNRSFMGFDFEQVVGDDILRRTVTEYKTNGQPKTWTLNYVTWSDFQTKDYIKNGTEILPWNEYIAKYPEFKYNNQLVKMLVSQSNQYCGQNTQLSQSDVYHNISVNIPKWDPNVKDEDGNVVGGYVDDYQQKPCLDLDAVYAQLALNKLPVDTKQMCEFVLVQGGADGYYSDWIVTLTEAKNSNTDITYEGRIMAEDLTVADKSDWDFNDVVFDWAIKGGKAYIKLLAAGGTLPLTIGGELINGEVVGGVEVHSADGLGKYMVNTGVNQGPAYKEFVLEGEHNTYTDGDANAIKLHVKKNVNGVQTWVEIEAEQGKPAGKFNSPVGTKCEEYANIKRVYTSFAAWVANASVTWAVNPVDKYVDYKNVEENKKEAPLTD